MPPISSQSHHHHQNDDDDDEEQHQRRTQLDELETRIASLEARQGVLRVQRHCQADK